MNHVPWLTLILVVPVGTAILLQLLPRHATLAIKALTLLGTLATAVIVAGVVIAYNHGGGGVPSARPTSLPLQFEERHDWIPGIGASYHLGIDGLSAWLLALNAGVFLLGAVVVSARTTERLKAYCTLLLLTMSATAGVLLSTDLLLFYAFWEGMLIPLYFLLSNWGDSNRGRATLKFVLYTVAGSLLMLVAIIYLAVQAGQAINPQSPSLTFDLQDLLAHPAAMGDHISVGGVSLLTPLQFAFIAFALAFAIKVPIVPFHTWLPDSYASAPPAVLTFFAGIVSKLGAYGFIRFGLTLFPQPVHDMQWILEGLAILSIIYGALMALSQNDIKRIVAYSSVSHLGFIVLGIFALNANGINGSIIQMINHGIIIAALFLIAGMIEARTGTRDLREIAGLEKRMPWLYAIFLVVTLAGLGMPGMNGFVGEFTIMLGAFQANPVLPVLAGVGVVLACWYMLRLHQGLMHEPLPPSAERVRDIGISERLVLLPLAALMVGIGLYPRPIGEVTRASVDQYVGLATSAPSSQPQSGTSPGGQG